MKPTSPDNRTDATRGQRPLALLARALRHLLNGRIRVYRRLGGLLRDDDGEVFVPFRKIYLDSAPGRQRGVGAILRVRFHFRNLPPWLNRALSLIPILLIVAQPGFRSKTWLMGRATGDFMGYYEFATVADAEAYWDSLPLRMMRKRAAEGSLTAETLTVSRETASRDTEVP